MEHIIIALTQGLRPHGRSGLKLPYIGSADLGDMSPPTRAEWIEIDYLYRTGGMMKVSPPTRAEWIEISFTKKQGAGSNRLRPHGRSGLKSGKRPHKDISNPSPPTRAEWIEISGKSAKKPKWLVSAHTGGVD